MAETTTTQRRVRFERLVREAEASIASNRAAQQHDQALRSDALHQHYWRPLLKRADSSPDPEQRPFTGRARFLQDNPLPREEVLNRIRKAVERETDHADTHPALRGRLDAIQAPPVLPGTVERSAAEAWLGPRLPEVLREFDRNWLERNREPWRQRFQYVQDARRSLEQLAARPDAELSHEERWNLAAWTEEFSPDEDALPLYRRYAQQAPDDRDADFAIGRILLERNDPAGLAYLESAMEHLPLALPACELAYDYWLRAGERNRADLWRRRGERLIDLADYAIAERDPLSPGV